MPTPRPINRQFFRCLAVASRSRGNHSSGAETCLPSARVTTRESLVKETCTASAAGLTPKVLIPRNYKLLAMLFNHFSDPVNSWFRNPQTRSLSNPNYTGELGRLATEHLRK